MAFLQSELPPSTAPVSTPRTLRSVSPGRQAPARRRSLGWIAGVAGAFLFGGLGYLAAQETESLAIGILAGDLAFLVAVAGWSTVASTRRG